MPTSESYTDFLRRLADEESGGKYDIASPSGTFIGKYQMGPGALQDAGYKDSKGKWTGKNGIFTDRDFRENKNNAQEDAISIYHDRVWKTIQSAGLDKYEGRVINGVKITKYGMIGAAHLRGVGKKNPEREDQRGLRQYLESGGKIDPADANNTPVSSYIKRLSGEDNVSAPVPVLKPNTITNEELSQEEKLLESMTIDKFLQKLENLDLDKIFEQPKNQTQKGN